MNLILGPPLCPCANEGSWRVCVMIIMVLSPLSVTVPSASSFSPVLHHNLVLLSLESLLDFMRLTSSRNMHFVVVIEASSATFFLSFFQIKKKSIFVSSLIFFLSFWFYTFFILKWGVGRKKNHTCSVWCVFGKKMAVLWLYHDWV